MGGYLAYNAFLVGQLAQLVEQRIENPRVRGSFPRLATKKYQAKTPIHVVGVFAFALRKWAMGLLCF